MLGSEAQGSEACPLCGATKVSIPDYAYINGVIFWKGRRIPFTYSQVKIIELLSTTLGHPVTHETIIKHIYGETGPTDRLEGLVSLIKEIRLRLVAYDVHLRIETLYRVGYIMTIGEPRTRKKRRPDFGHTI